jgi:minor extracellular protease Epr
VGMLDTAVSESSPALAGDRIKQRHFGESRASVQGAEHGTAVATILAGQVDAGFAGLLPRATLFAADVFNYGAGEHKSTNAMMIARGLDWLLAQHPAAINVSIAGPENAVLHEAIRRVTAQGIPVIAAAGNLGPDGPPRYPAAYAEAIAVTAVDLLGQPYEQANRGPYIDVAAPGVHIWSAGANGRGKFFDGTSFATPFVTAEVALLRSAEPQRSPPELKAAFHTPTDSVRLGAVTAGVLKSHGCGDVPYNPN